MLEHLRQALAPGLLIERELGRGAMGVVYLARDPTLDRPVAVKVLSPERATATAAARFIREARLLARLDHPHIVRVHQAGEVEGFLFFVMDFVPGETLATRLAHAGGPLPEEETRQIAEDVLGALTAAHALGVVHRDVKPANIFLHEGRARLADFGIAQIERTDLTTLTADGGLVGTPAYMAPEQLTGDPVTPAADLYALGQVLYECASGRRWSRVLDATKSDWSGVPPSLVAPLQRALALSPGARWSSAKAFCEALGNRPRRRTPVLVGAGVLLLAIALGIPLTLPRCQIPRGLGPIAKSTRLCAAERMYKGGRWTEAKNGYLDVFGADTACIICRFRQVDIDRWLGQPKDTQVFAWLANRRDRLDAGYRAVLDAEMAPPSERLSRLERVVRDYPDLALGWYLVGEERFHRGPLQGQPRRGAGPAFERGLVLDPAFVGPLYDLVLLYVALGDSNATARTLRRVLELGPADGLAAAERGEGAISAAYRFGMDPMPAVHEAMTAAHGQHLSELPAGPRLLSAFGVYDGAVHLGRFFEDSGGAELRESGLIAQVFGHVARGQLEAARTVASRLLVHYPSVERRFTLLELDVVLALFDAPGAFPTIRDSLKVYAHAAQPDGVRHRAELLLALVSGNTDGDILEPDAPEPFRVVVRGFRVARQGNYDSALVATRNLSADQLALRNADPFLRTILRLARGDWAAADGNPGGADLAWRWHEHFDMDGFPAGDVDAVDVDWAFGPLATYKLAQVLDRAADPANQETCRAHAEVARVWAEGDPLYRSRADSARTRFTALGCVK